MVLDLAVYSSGRCVTWQNRGIKGKLIYAMKIVLDIPRFVCAEI